MINNLHSNPISLSHHNSNNIRNISTTSTINPGPISSSNSTAIASSTPMVANKRRRLTSSEWITTVLCISNQLRWNEKYYDEKEKREYLVASSNPNKTLEELIRLCPLNDLHSPSTSPEGTS